MKAAKKAESLLWLHPQVETQTKIPEDLKGIPCFDLLTALHLVNRLPILGRGNSGLVVQFQNYALKIAFGRGMSEELASTLARKCHDKTSAQDTLKHKFLADLSGTTDFVKQIQAFHRGSKLFPQYIDDSPALFIDTYKQIVAYLLPLYTGKFVSVLDAGIPSQELLRIKEAGIVLDTFRHRENAVILDDNSVRLFDLTLT